MFTVNGVVCPFEQCGRRDRHGGQAIVAAFRITVVLGRVEEQRRFLEAVRNVFELHILPQPRSKARLELGHAHFKGPQPPQTSQRRLVGAVVENADVAHLVGRDVQVAQRRVERPPILASLLYY